ncbi:hypothetical protein J3R30DRAFT_3451318 [Lentinula aciculospora]|uniref:Uncharacterized protein n=1 Tax=Lentinula aciculospora TaxID=153920 RepID=A0A9W9DSN4_9AGAR|nr:hypothetical protein J3R30DRAFT_3451318 [Lentinula aciculospora]
MKPRGHLSSFRVSFMAPSDVDKLCSIVSSLGGPTYTPAELEWATQIAPGKALIKWIAAQLPSEGSNPDDEYAQRAFLSRIALENEEVNMLQNSELRMIAINFSSYIPPSRQSSKTTLIENNAYLLEQEAFLLQRRLQGTNTISQRIQKTAQAIAAELDRLQSSIVEKQEELERSSLKGDTVIFGSRSKSFDLLKCLQDNLQLDITSDYLTNCLDIRKQITQNVTEQLTTIDIWKDQQPSCAALELEALRLQHAFENMAPVHSSLLSSAEESAYCQQLELLVSFLEEEVDGNEGEIYDVLQQVAIMAHEEPYPGPPDIVKELELVWNIDQQVILKARISVISKAYSQFQQSILPSLQKIQAVLAEQQSYIQEILIVLGAFGQEMDGVAYQLDIAKAKTQEPSQNLSADFNHRHDSAMEQEMKKLLKDVQTLRLSNMPPLVLMDQNGILSALRALKENEMSMINEEEKLCSSIPITLNSLMDMHDPALNAIYTHSAVNTSPPFQLAPSVTVLQRNAKDKGEGLTAEIQRLQKDLKILNDDRAQRKLKSFVERWISMS